MSFIVGSTVTRTFLDRVQASPDRVGFRFKKGAHWEDRTFRQFYTECRLLSFGLIGLGVRPGDKIVLLSNTRYEWSLLDMAILGAGGITVPIYASSTPDDASFIIEHSDATVIIAENAAQLAKVQRPGGRKLVVIDPLGVIESPAVSLERLSSLGQAEESRRPKAFDETLASAKPGDLITICYTSGTTGVPKGAMLTHDNMMSVLGDAIEAIGRHLRPDHESVLSFLPFSHVLGKVESMAVYAFGWTQSFAQSMEKLTADLRETNPTLLFSVPRVFEKAHHAIQSSVAKSSAARQAVYSRALTIGRSYYEDIWAGRSPSIRKTVEYKLARKLVFDRICRSFGARLRIAICGGAPLSREIGEFFQIVGIQILEGYGLTETCAPVTVNTPDHLKFGSPGRPMADVTVKFSDDGEILLRSRKIFKGYYKAPEETAAAMADGWFHTGDIGHLDDDGFLWITDRKKDLIITSGGKNVAPQKIENLAQTHKIFTHFVVVGDRRKYLSALVTLDREHVIQYATEQRILFSEYAELIRHPKIVAWAQKELDAINVQLAHYETIKKFVILPNEFSIDTGELTPSLKVRRAFVAKRYKSELDALYADSSES